MKIINKVVTKHDKKIFDIHVELLNILHRLKLTVTEKKVLSEMYYQYNSYTGLTAEERSTLLFSTKIHMKVTSNLNITSGTYNNIVSKFRKVKGNKGCLIEERDLNKAYIISPESTNYFIIQIDKHDTVNDTQQHSNREERTGEVNSEEPKE